MPSELFSHNTCRLGLFRFSLATSFRVSFALNTNTFSNFYQMWQRDGRCSAPRDRKSSPSLRAISEESLPYVYRSLPRCFLNHYRIRNGHTVCFACHIWLLSRQSTFL